MDWQNIRHNDPNTSHPIRDYQEYLEEAWGQPG